MTFLLGLYMSMTAHAEVQKLELSCEEPFYCIEAELNKNGASLYLVTKQIGPLQFRIDGPVDEFAPSAPFPLVVRAEALSRKYLATLVKFKKQNASRLKVEMKWGSFDAELKDDVFQLPYDSKNSYPVVQGYNSSPTHNGDRAWAVDFGMTEGTDVLAARDGVVVYLRQDFNLTAVVPDDYEKANVVLLLHDGGVLSYYAHLRYQSVVVKVGDRVRAGQKIAQSGMTGRAKSPHLHFHVFRPVDWRKFGRTFPIRFKTPDGKILPEPQRGATYP